MCAGSAARGEFSRIHPLLVGTPLPLHPGWSGQRPALIYSELSCRQQISDRGPGRRGSGGADRCSCQRQYGVSYTVLYAQRRTPFDGSTRTARLCCRRGQTAATTGGRVSQGGRCGRAKEPASAVAAVGSGAVNCCGVLRAGWAIWGAMSSWGLRLNQHSESLELDYSGDDGEALGNEKRGKKEGIKT